MLSGQLPVTGPLSEHSEPRSAQSGPASPSALTMPLASALSRCLRLLLPLLLLLLCVCVAQTTAGTPSPASPVRTAHAQSQNQNQNQNHTKTADQDKDSHHRPKRGWIWNQFYVLEEHIGPEAQHVGKVNICYLCAFTIGEMLNRVLVHLRDCNLLCIQMLKHYHINKLLGLLI